MSCGIRKLALTFTSTALLALGLAGPAQAAFGIAAFDGEVSADAAHTAFTQAGGHPYLASTTLELNTTVKEGLVVPEGALKDATVDLPPGLIGNPTAVTKCPRDREIPSLSQATEEIDPRKFCPLSSIVGIAALRFTAGGGFIETNATPVYNLEPSSGVAAQFGLSYINQRVYLDASLRDDGTYGVSVRLRSANQGAPLYGAMVSLWGNPADPSHDSQRCIVFLVPMEFQPVPLCNDFGGAFSPLLGPNPFPADVSTKALLANPTACTAPGEGLETRLRVESWKGESVFSSFESHNPPGFGIIEPKSPSEWGSPQGPTGCADVPFTPSAAAQPTGAEADSPTALSVDLTMPTDGLEDPLGIAQSHLKKAVVTLPEGMSVNPSSATGLGSCAPAQLANEKADSAPGAGCPLSSKIGTVSIDTPLLEERLGGSVYLAKQNDNPFNSLLALYLVVKSPERGVVVKLPGRVDPDPQTGRLTATFDDNPQLPFSSLHVDFKTGSRAPLLMPSQCGTYTIETDLYPWARPADPVHQTSTFNITSGPDGTPCPTPGQFAPGFEAGTLTPIAGAFSPLLVNASRPDGSEVLRGLSLGLPEGLTAKLAGVPYCPEAALAAAAARVGKAELASSSCPAASRIGSVDVGAGAGTTPFHVQGTAYLTGPYKGAPLSIAVITPAVAGPFDLGTVVVRAKADVDPATAQIHVTSDPIPQILQGIPLKVRSIAVNTDRPEFTLNPTDCNPMSLVGTLFGSSALVAVSSRFQVGACKALDFGPKLSLRLKGKTKRSGHPALTAVLTQPANGQANVGKVSVTLPRAQFIDQSRIGDVCTRAQFAAKACPANSVLGTATAFTPLLEQPLRGTVYLRGNGGERELPDMVAALRGQIDVDLVGYVDAVVDPKNPEISRIRNTFAIVPDAPVSRFVLKLNAGKRALLENSRNLCKGPQRAAVRMDGQNGKAHDIRPVVRNDCGKTPQRRR